MGEPYSPAPGVELIGPLGDNRGILVIGGRRWPVVEVASYWTSGGHAGGWMARIPFENGAVVLIVAHPDHVYDHGDVVGQTEPALFTASLHHQFGVSPADRFPQEAADPLPIASMVDGMLDLHPDLDTWQLHYDPEPEWLNWWLLRVAGLAASEQRRASA
jgi:hypothetical protein